MRFHFFSFCRQEEILEYLKSFARHFDLYKHIKFNQKVSIVEWNDKTQMWKIKTEQGHEYEANFVVSAPGPLHKPSIPKFKGMLHLLLIYKPKIHMWSSLIATIDNIALIV